jgi:hypothetical protein
MAIKTSKSFLDAAPQVVQDDNKLPAQKVGRRRTMTIYLTENHYTYLKQLKQEKMIGSSDLIRTLLDKYMEENPL